MFSYRDRKVKKRDFRALWIIRIKAGCELAGMAYSRFIKGLSSANVEINRKILADLAVNSPVAFNKLVEVAQQANAASAAKPVAKVAKKIK